MNPLEFITALARRPNPSLSPVAQAAKAKMRNAAAVTSEGSPVTAAEIVEGMRACFQLRMEIETLKAELEEKRERACDEGDEEALAELDESERNLKNQLRIIDRREVEISSRLREVKAIEKSRRFEEAKRDLVAAAEEFLPTLVAVVRAHDKYRDVRARVATDFNSANDFLPGMFALSDADIQEFTADISRLRRTVLGTRATPLAMTVASMIDRALKTGERPSGALPCSEDIDKAFGKSVTVVTIKSTRDLEGKPLKVGAEVSLPYPLAMDLVGRGVAKVKA